MARFPIFLPNQGVVVTKPEELLLSNFSPYSRNVEFWNERLQGRGGLSKFDNAALPDKIMLAEQFWRFDGTWDLVVFTKRDICAYDFGNTRYDYLTPQYTTGTITIAGGALTTVEGAGGCDWVAAGIKEGDFIKIGSGGAHSGSTWYEIDSVTDVDTLVLKTDGATCTGSAYIIRKTFSGAATDFWDAETFQDSALGSVLISTNGIDTPVYWTGTGLVTAITGLATGFTAAKWVTTFKDRVVFLFTTEGGAAQAQRVRWSAVGDCCDYPDTNFQDLTGEDTWITGHAKLSNYFLVFKETEAYVTSWIGEPYVFDFNKSDTCSGARSRNSIVSDQCSGWVYYYTSENRFKRWNLIREEDIAANIFDDTKNFIPALDSYIFGKRITYKNQIRWFCPKSNDTYNDYVVVYDTLNNILEIWEYEQEQACCCIGEYVNTADLYVDDSVWGEYYLDEQDGFWDEVTFLGSAPVVIYGGYDGYLRKADQTQQDDGTDYTRIFRTSRLNFGSPDISKRIQNQQWWFDAESAGSVKISCKRDDANDFDVTTHNISLLSDDKDTIKRYITWNKKAENFQFQVEATNYFALLGFISNVFQKGGVINSKAGD
jgi:hypothetical protein